MNFTTAAKKPQVPPNIPPVGTWYDSPDDLREKLAAIIAACKAIPEPSPEAIAAAKAHAKARAIAEAKAAAEAERRWRRRMELAKPATKRDVRRMLRQAGHEERLERVERLLLQMIGGRDAALRR